MALKDRIRKLEAAMPPADGKGRCFPVLTTDDLDPAAHLTDLIAKGEAAPGDEVFVIRLVGVEPPAWMRDCP
jgi:hypothetical protein